MSDDQVRTEVRTDDGWLEFQDYFVGRHQEPEVHEVRFRGAESAAAAPGVVEAHRRRRARSSIAPSNPIVSVGPILAVRRDSRRPSTRARERGVRIVAVSGIVGGKALKGPADRMLASLGHESSALGVARIYADLATDFVLDAVDADLAPAIEALGLRAHVTDTIMTDDAARARLAAECLAIGSSHGRLTAGRGACSTVPPCSRVATLVLAASSSPRRGTARPDDARPDGRRHERNERPRTPRGCFLMPRRSTWTRRSSPEASSSVSRSPPPSARSAC